MIFSAEGSDLLHAHVAKFLTVFDREGQVLTCVTELNTETLEVTIAGTRKEIAGGFCFALPNDNAIQRALHHLPDGLHYFICPEGIPFEKIGDESPALQGFIKELLARKPLRQTANPPPMETT